MPFYNITAFTEGDEFSTNYGPLVTYWLEIDGIEGTIRTNKKPGNSPRLGQQWGELEVKTNKKGGQYYNFKGSKAPDGVETPKMAQTSSRPSSDIGGAMPGWFVPVAKQIDFIYKEMKNVEEPVTEEIVTREEKEPIAPDVQKLLDDTFGPTIEEDLSQESEGSARK